jgi:uncharacterized repeat protein (TIGR01451 family)
LSAVSGGTSVTLNNVTIAPNSTCTIRVNVTSNTQGSYLNTIPANALQTQQGPTNTSPDSDRLNVQEIGITKAFSPPSFVAGSTSTLTITLQNPTGSPYTGVSVSDTLPGTVLTVVPGSAATTCGGSVSITLPRAVSLTGGTIPPGTVTSPGTCTITFQITAPVGTPSATYLNTITVGAVTNDQGVTNVRSATASVTVAGVDLTGIKSFSPSNIVPGGNSRLRNEIGFALWQLGRAITARGDYLQGKIFMEESLAVYKELKLYGGVTFVLADLGKAALGQGDYGQAASYYKEAMNIYWNRGNERNIAEGLEQLASVAVMDKKLERAARLLGTVEVLRQTSKSEIFPYQKVELLHSLLDETSLSTSWAEGRSMNVKQVVENALREKS